MSITSFTIIFLVLLTAQTLMQFYLSARQVRAVSLHKDEVPAEFAHKISLQSHQRAALYTIERQRLSMLMVFVNVIVTLGFTVFGGLAYLNYHLNLYISSPIWYQIALILSIFAISALVDLPFSWYRTFVIEAKFGFNRMTPKLFIMDLVKANVIGLIIVVPLLYAFFTFVERFYTPYWWIWAWVAFSIIMLLLMFIVPKFIMPLFNKFTPLDNPELQERIQALAKRANFGLKELYVMDGSKRSAHGNAFFTGFGRNRRIVFFDTLLNKLTPSEIEAVLAHELGHFKHKHIIKRLIFSLVFSLLFFAALGYLLDKTWFYVGLGAFPDSGIPFDPASGEPLFGIAIVLFSIFFPLITFWYTPISSFLSRKDEFEADSYAATQSSATELISALVKLYNDNAATLTPDGLHSAFYDSHPPASIRIQHLKEAH